MNIADELKNGALLTRGFWAHAWQQLQDQARFKISQEQHPQRWQQFYDRMASTWEAVTGGGPPAAQAVVQALHVQGLLWPGATVLEVGCGSGSLALAMAGHVEKVTAVDDSTGMLAILRERAARSGISNITARQADWKELKPDQAHDLALAAFFPDVMNPGGLERLERLSRRACALVVGAGQEALPLRRALWPEIMGHPLPSIAFQLPCALGYLLASGRLPDLRHIAWQARLDLAMEQVADFFENYFAIFGKHGPGVRQSIDRILGEFAANGRLRLESQTSAALITWPAPGGEP